MRPESAEIPDIAMSSPPALLTPNTLARIRAGAGTRAARKIAEDLGWDLARLRRCAAAHGIELFNPNPTADLQETNVVKPQAPPPSLAPTPTAVTSAVASLQAIAVRLPRRQRALLETLIPHVDGRTLEALDLAARMGMTRSDSSRSSVCEAARVLRAKLQPTRWTIESQRGTGGGYRLVTLKEPAP
jgi:hypothetical protein